MRSITVTGHGRASAPPDTVALQVGVRTRARAAADALANATDKQHQIVAAVAAAGSTGAEVQSSGLSCRAVTDERGGPRNAYEVSAMLLVRSRDVEGAGSLLDAVVAAAGNDAEVHGLSLSIADDTDLTDAARSAAMADALRKAEHYAALADVHLGKLQSIDETTGAGGGGGGPMLRMAATSMPVEVGESEISVAIVAVYAID